MKLGITNVMYLAFRLAPFIIVSFFTLQSLFNWNLKGIIYLAGLMFACILSVLFGNSNFLSATETTGVPDPRCNIITLNDTGTLTNIPLSITIFSYTFFYLLIFIINLASTGSNDGFLKTDKTNLNMAMQQNIPTMIIFPLLIIIESMWIVSNNCITTVNVLLAILAAATIGCVVGILWAVIIASLKKPELQYVTVPGLEVCNLPSKALYRCRPRTSNA
jgi:hypothetical protein